MKPQKRMDMYKVGNIMFGFVLINFFVAVFVNAVLGSSYSIGPSAQYNVFNYLLLSIVVGMVAGGLGGLVLVRINKSLFRKKSFLAALSLTALFFVIVFLVVNAISSMITVGLTEDNLSSSALYITSLKFMFNPLSVVIFSLWGIVSLVTLFFLQMSDKFGPGKLWRFIQGYYFKPREETRVFMFADLRSSTTIAERLSNKEYFNLLSSLFVDITDPILDHEGEIYQYIGDEIVVTWPISKAVKDNNCLNCFHAIEKKVNALGPNYEKLFGVRPEFKAGIHHGKVIAGEIGIIKKDIVYTGDVLNTASRIQEQCNVYKVNLLLSGDTIELLNLKGLKKTKLGRISLRGKIVETDLVTIANH